MPTFFPSSRRIFWFYGLLIPLLGWYAYHLHQNAARRQAQQKDEIATLAKALTITSRVFYINYVEVEKEAKDYPSAFSNEIKRQSASVLQLLDTVRKQLKPVTTHGANHFDPYDNPLPYTQTVLQQPALKQSVWQQLQMLGDSLRLYASKDSATLAKIQPLLSAERRAALENLLATDRPEEMTLAMLMLLIDHNQAANIVLQHLRQKVECNGYVFKGSVPVLIPEKTCIQAGETFKAEAYMVNYLAMGTKYDKMTINGEKLPIENGIGIYKKVFRKAGEQNLKFVMEITNPTTMLKETVAKDFKIEVCE